MTRERDERYPTDAFGLPEGLLAAVVGWLLLVGAFALASSATPMPPAERWAALTAVAVLAAGVTLPGCAALYDALGRVVRRDWRALGALVALVPALYAAYAAAVRELDPRGLAAACLFAGVPALAFGLGGRSRTPTVADAVALGYLALSLGLGLLPGLSLPQQGGLVGFFQLAVVPLLLLLFAARGWPGLGYTWHLSWPELRDALLAGLAAGAVITAGALLAGLTTLAPGLMGAGALITAVVGGYFFTALPTELLLRGGVQRGLEWALRGRMGATAAWVALTATVALTAALGWARGGWFAAALGAALALAAGWAYLRTGKVTASAVTTLLGGLILDLVTTV